MLCSGQWGRKEGVIGVLARILIRQGPNTTVKVDSSGVKEAWVNVGMHQVSALSHFLQLL